MMESGKPSARAARACAQNSNSAFHLTPVVRIANSRSLPGSTERKRNRSPISAATLPNDGICIHGLNGPGRDVRGSRTLEPGGPLTMYSQKAFCSASRSLGPTSGSRDIESPSTRSVNGLDAIDSRGRAREHRVLLRGRVVFYRASISPEQLRQRDEQALDVKIAREHGTFVTTRLDAFAHPLARGHRIKVRW